MTVVTLNGGVLDFSNSSLSINSSNITLVQNYGISGGFTDICSNMFNVTTSNISLPKTTVFGSNLALNNSWSGKNTFIADASFNNATTLINSSSLIGLSGGIVNISGGAVNVAGNTTFKNTTTQINSSSLIGLSGDIINISGGVINIGGASKISQYITTTTTVPLQVKIGGTQVSGLFGNAVALSYDGNTMAVGSYNVGSGNGIVIIYTRSGTTWTQQQQFNGSSYYTGGEFGKSVALDACGNTLAVGSDNEGPLVAGAPPGAVRIFIRTGTNWSLQDKLTGTRTLGHSVSLSSDGNTLAAGEPMLNGGYGGCRIFIRVGTNWSLQQQISYPDSVPYQTSFGDMLSLSSDGNTLAVGASSDSVVAVNRGSVRVYTRASGTWSPQYRIDGTGTEQLGFSVAISSDGNTIVASPKSSSSAYLYFKTGSTWTKQSKTFNGSYMTFSSDGNSILVGGSAMSSTSNVYLYTKTGIDWNNASALYLGTTTQQGMGNTYGNILSLSYDGRTIAFGSSYENSQYGAVSVYAYVYTYSPNTSTYISSLSDDTKLTSYNGYSTYINNDKTSGNVRINVNSPNSNVIIENGNVCIGKISPSYTLDVNGTTSSSKFICGNGDNVADQGVIINTGWIDASNYSAFAPLKVSLRGTSVFQVNTNGYIGIGTSSPSYTLDVNGTTRCSSGVWATSDKRIKTNIIDIDDNNALSILRKIQPKTYQYVDKKSRGNNTVIGFIAQEIAEIIPNAYSISKDYAPTFYTGCQISPTDVSNIMLVTSPIDLSWNPLHDASGNAYLDASGDSCSDASGNKVFNIIICDQSNNQKKCKTISILDKRSFLMDISGSNIVDASGVLQNEYFLYGQEVDDFHNIDKAAIFTVVTAAVQDIDRVVQTNVEKINADSERITILEEQVASLQSQLALFQSQLPLLQSQLALFQSQITSLLANK